jgi:Protein of unknown function (DUF3096)
LEATAHGVLQTPRRGPGPVLAGDVIIAPLRHHAMGPSLEPRTVPGSRGVMTVTHVQPLVALVAGILILLVPRLLNFIVAIYLIIIGVTGLWPRLLH